MQLRFKCPGCYEEFPLRAGIAGQFVKCPKCPTQWLAQAFEKKSLPNNPQGIVTHTCRCGVSRAVGIRDQYDKPGWILRYTDELTCEGCDEPVQIAPWEFIQSGCDLYGRNTGKLRGTYGMRNREETQDLLWKMRLLQNTYWLDWGDYLEYFVALLYKHNGCIAMPRGRPGDGGADLIVHKGRHKTAVQVKTRTGRSIGPDAVQQVFSAKALFNAAAAAAVTDKEFSRAAIELANFHEVQLIDCYGLAALYALSDKEAFEKDFEILLRDRNDLRFI